MAALSVSACGHCGLPSPRGEPYCCYGCELAAGIASEGAEEQVNTKAALTFSLLLSMAVMMLSLFLFAEDVYGAPPGSGLAWMRSAYRALSAALATPVVLLLGVPLIRRAARAVRRGRPSMELLVGAGAFAAYGLSLVGLFRPGTGVYFDSATSALVLATLGRYLEATARAKASRVLGPLLDLAREPVEADPDGSGFRLVAPTLIEPGTRIRVGVDRAVPVDARVVGAPAEVNLAVLTGAAAPVTLAVGDELPAGAVPVSAPVEAVALRCARDSTLERLAALAKDLGTRRTRLARLADAFAAALVPGSFALSIGSFAWWTAHESAARGAIVALAVALAACPCTYGVSTPLVLWLALRRALDAGVCIRDAAALEALAGIRAVAFDKTGTLTERELAVIGVETAEGTTAREALAIAAALDAGSRHPVAAAIVAQAAREGVAPARVRERRIATGGGTGIDAEGRAIAVGSLAFLREHGVAVDGAAAGADVRVGVARDGVLLARLRVGEKPRAEAAAAVKALAELGIESVVLTGDSAEGSRAIGAELGIGVEAGLLPAAKVERLRRLGPHVAMVGDGLNDAPALAGAALGIAAPEGTDLARGVARVTLLRRDLRLVPWAVALARRAVRIARQNLLVATAYNVVFLGLAASGALRPVWAGLSMLTSSVLTIALSVRASVFPAASEEERETEGEAAPAGRASSAGAAHAAPPRALVEGACAP